MKQKSGSIYWVLPGAIALGWTVMGCGAEADDPGDQPAVNPKVVKNAEPAGTLRILFNDTRTATRTIVRLDGWEDGPHGMEPVCSFPSNVIGDLPGTNNYLKSSAFLKWRWEPEINDRQHLDNWLFYENYYPLPYSDIYIYGNGVNYYQNIRVTVNTDFDGQCYEDYEDVPAWGGGDFWSGDVYLFFSGWRATSWDGECFRGDMLQLAP